MTETQENPVVTRAQVIESARTYLGVAYKNQGRSGDGLDCGGLVLRVGYDLGLTELQFLGYANNPDGETFERLLKENCDEVTPKENAEISDLLVMDYGLGIQHVAFLVQTASNKNPDQNYLKVLHAKRMRGVIETRLLASSADYRGWIKTFRIRGLERE